MDISFDNLRIWIGYSCRINAHKLDALKTYSGTISKASTTAIHITDVQDISDFFRYKYLPGEYIFEKSCINDITIYTQYRDKNTDVLNIVPVAKYR